MIKLIQRNFCQKLKALRLQRAFLEQEHQQVGRRDRASFEPPDAPGLLKVQLVLDQLTKLNGEELRMVRQYVGEIADQQNYLSMLDRVGKDNPVVAGFLQGAIFGERAHRQVNSAILREVSKFKESELQKTLGEDVKPASKDTSLITMLLKNQLSKKAVDYLVPQLKDVKPRRIKKIYADPEVKDDKKGADKKKK